MSHIFEFDSRIMTDKDIGLLAALEERFPDEITVTDKVVAVCKTPRLTRIILEALNTNPDDQEPEQEQLTYVLSPDSFKHARAEMAELAQPTIEEDRSPSTPYSSPEAPDRSPGNLAPPEPAPSAIWLDQSSGEILDIREINARLRAGSYKPGRFLRRGDGRTYTVEQRVNKKGQTEFRLKQVYT